MIYNTVRKINTQKHGMKNGKQHLNKRLFHTREENTVKHCPACPRISARLKFTNTTSKILTFWRKYNDRVRIKDTVARKIHDHFPGVEIIIVIQWTENCSESKRKCWSDLTSYVVCIHLRFAL